MEALKRLTLALAAVAAMGVGCGDDDDGGDGPNMTLDSGIRDAALDSNVPKSDAAADASAGLECPSYTAPTATLCGGNHCKQTLDQLKATVSATAVCKTDAELGQFCQVSSVAKVTKCVTDAYLAGGASNPEVLKTMTATCSAAALPDYSASCLGCFNESAICAANKCLTKCYPNSMTAACDQCRATECIPAFYTCTGIKSPL